MRLWSRRRVLTLLGAAGVAAGGWLTYQVARTLREEASWEELLRFMPAGGQAAVKALRGEASFGRMMEALVGKPIPNGERIHVAPDSVLVLGLPDRSLLQVRGEAEIELQVDRYRGGMYNLFLGAVLAVVPAGSRFLAMGPTTAVGVKGTVFYREAFGAARRRGLTMEGRMPIPEGVHDYFCTCHGEVGWLRPGVGEGEVQAETAHHHSAWFLRRRRPLERQRAPMMNHFDDEIADLIAQQDPPRHDTEWLDVEGAARPENGGEG